jgi:hypothetical protein
MTLHTLNVNLWVNGLDLMSTYNYGRDLDSSYRKM